MTSPDAKRPRLSRTDWLEAALQLASSHGVHAVSVNRLASEIGITRGSFYHHFENRQDLLDSMLDYWENFSTVDLLSEVASATDDPAKRLLLLDEKVQDQRAGRYELAIAAWASWNDDACARMESAHERRMRFLVRIFRGLGFDSLESRVRAHAVYAFHLGNQSFSLELSARERREGLLRRHALWTAK